MLSIVLLVSGNLGNKILDYLVKSSYHIKAVLTDKKSNSIISKCEDNDIPAFIGNPRKGKSKTFMADFEFDVLLSVNYLFIVEEDLLKMPQKYAVNLHGSLLPKYRGRTPHVWAIINGEKQTGVTAHLMSQGVDEGQIIKQISIPINENDRGTDILSQFETVYPKLVEEVLHKIENNEVVLYQQDSTKSTYFGKRTPEDGQINWSWSRERIKNWIRAQAKPYPGAFTFCQGEKIVTHQAALSDFGFHQDQLNGTILHLTETEIIVKTATGAIVLSQLEFATSLELEIGKKLS